MNIKTEQKVYLIDAKNRILGRLATSIANILRGKEKVDFVPHLDQGDKVVIVNAKDIKLTGNKIEKKIYYHHSGYPGGLKEKKLCDLMEESPGEVIKKAVYGMLPNNKLRDVFMKKLAIFDDDSYKEKGDEIKVNN